MWVYCITNTSNGKQYVGITTRDVGLRFSEHIRQARTDKYKIGLHGAIKKYGPDAFVVEVISEASCFDDLCRQEVEFISKMGTMSPRGYNLKSGGVEGFYSAEVRSSMSINRTGISPSEDTRRKLSEAHKKIPRTQSQLDALSQARVGNKHCLGRVLPQSQKDNIGNGNRGKKRTDKTKAMLSEINSGNNHPQSDKNIYKFQHASGMTFEGTRVDFKNLVGGRTQHLWGANPRKQHKGWTLVNT